MHNFQNNALINNNCEIFHKKGRQRMFSGLLVGMIVTIDTNKHIKQLLYY